ncbi:MAG: hypothetical protein J0M00_03130 [Burkholderiales bacterium]|nr:hypothetical protein [Burkholderiales bacterium]
MKSNRFTVSLDEGVMPEWEVIQYLKPRPVRRRQQDILAFVYAGRAAIVSGAPLYSQLDFSGLPRDKVRYDIYLQPNAGHDKLVLDSIKDIPRYQQPQWLKVALVMGHIAHTRRISG